MKLFDFKCGDCGHEFEELVKEGETAICPACNSNQTQKQISGPTIKNIPRYFGNNHDPAFRKMTGGDAPRDPYSTI